MQARLIIKDPQGLVNAKLSDQITDLELVSKELTGLPSGLENCQHLKKLSIYFDQLLLFPVEIRLLRQLEFLKIIRGKIQIIPKLNWPNLKKVMITQQQIHLIDPSFFELFHLEELSLASNKITHLPANFKNLHRLKRLNLDSNPLQNFNFKKSDFPCLHSLSFDQVKFNEEVKSYLKKEFQLWSFE